MRRLRNTIKRGATLAAALACGAWLLPGTPEALGGIAAVALEGAEVLALRGDEEGILDPEFAGFLVDVSERLEVGETVVGL